MEIGFGYWTADEGEVVAEAYHELVWLTGA